MIVHVLWSEPFAIYDDGTVLAESLHFGPVDKTVSHIGLGIVQICYVLQVGTADFRPSGEVLRRLEPTHR